MKSTSSNSVNIQPDSVEVLLRLQQVMEVVPAARSTLYNWISKGIFPRPVQIGPRCVAWRRSDIQNFISSKISVGPPTTFRSDSKK